ncbi:MAG: D-alanyl-D-alanine carboxypeptidase [Cyclobacteriaceae bacterium]
MKIKLFYHIAIFCVGFIGLNACQSIKSIATSRDINSQLKKSEIFSQQFTGLVLYDPIEKRYLKDFNGDKHFTPASNTKILTMAASLSVLGDSIPTFRVLDTPDTLFVEPFGDPTFLHPDFPNQPVFDQLKGKHVQVILNKPIQPFGAGWAWDDYPYDFQGERSQFPIYGNMLRITLKDTLKGASPNFFSEFISVNDDSDNNTFIARDVQLNIFQINNPRDTTTVIKDIPFKYSDELLEALLKDTLQNEVSIGYQKELTSFEILRNTNTISAIALMMLRSDNFLAEQLLITSANLKGYDHIGAYRRDLIRQWGLPESTQWVDGSGLSRYNLISPRSLVSVLDKIYEQYDWSLITTVFPTGGVSGTIKNWYPGEPPYIFAKTGTLSNNHSLSGFILTRSGKTLIFSFMNNNYTRPVSEVKKEMQVVLELIRDGY